MKVKLTYFRPNGRYYTEAEYETTKGKGPLYKIWDEIEELQKQGKHPGLVEGACAYIILVNVPKHQHEHPHLIMPQKTICTNNKEKENCYGRN